MHRDEHVVRSTVGVTARGRATVGPARTEPAGPAATGAPPPAPPTVVAAPAESASRPAPEPMPPATDMTMEFRRPVIKAVWSDFAGVMTPPNADTVRAFCERVGVTPEFFIAAMREVGDRYGTDSMGPLDTPLTTQDRWSAQVSEILTYRYGEVVDLTDFGEKWFAGRPVNTAWLDWLRGVRARGIFVGMMSNMVPAWDPLWRRMIPPEQFDALVLSYQIGVRKPEPGIFEVAQRESGVAAQHCVLIDDVEKNCAGAREAGWHAVRFTHNESVIDRMEFLMGTHWKVRR